MPDEGLTDLSEVLRTRRAAVEHATSDAIGGLREIARRLDLAETASALTDTARDFAADNFRVLVTGRFKNGKSTLLNALLGGTTRPVDLGGKSGPMVVEDLPATAALSSVSYADVPSVRVLRLDGGAEEWPIKRYLEESALVEDDLENARRFQGIAEFELGFPARLCAANVTLYDAPGLDENSIRSRLTREAWKRCDTAIFVYGTRALMGEGELADDALLREDGTRVFVVVNLFDGRPANERLRAYVWNKYVRDYRQGPGWAGQDLADYDIYFVNAKLAADARYGPGGAAAERAYRDSGLAAFEQRLGRFLIDERFQIRLGTFTRRALNLGDRIGQHISQRQAALIADRNRLQAQWLSLQPRIESLNTRPERASRIIQRYRQEAVANLTASFTALVAGVRADLPGHLQAVTLPTEATTTFALWHQKRLTQEATEEVNAFVTRRVADWADHEAEPYLRTVMDRLGEELSEEIADIGRQFDALNMAMSGWDSAVLGTRGNVFSTSERVTGAIAGLIFGDFGGVAGGGAGGWRTIGGIAGALGASWLLIGILGLTAGVVFLPILAIAAVIVAASGSAGLVGRIKRKALEAADERLALLPPQVSDHLASDLNQRFDALTEAVTQEVSDFVEEQRRSLESQVEASRQAEAEKAGALRELEAAGAEVGRHRETLESVLAEYGSG